MKIRNEQEMRDILKDAARERRQQILALHQSGQSLTKIGAQLGISKQRVSDLLKRARGEV